MFFHRHKWSEYARTYATSTVKDFSSLIFIDSTNREKAMFGVTTIMLKCEVCPKIKKLELLGKIIDTDIPTLERMMKS